MLLTDKVSMSWLEKMNMTRGGQIGVPVDLKELGKGVKWKELIDLTDDDFEMIDSYYDMKTTKA